MAAEDASRAALIALLTSPHWTLPAPAALDEPPSRAAIAALDRLLQELRFLGGWEQLAKLDAALSTQAPGSSRQASLWRRAESGMRAALQLRPVFERIGGAGQCVGADRRGARVHHDLRAATADRNGIRRAADARACRHRRRAHCARETRMPAYDDRPLAAAELWATVRRWIEGQTFAPRTGSGGVRLLDAAAAPYAQLDAMRIVGLVESDWPERSIASIFYPAWLLRELGWPADADRLAAARARFDDLLRLPAARVAVSAFTLEDDAIVPPSPFVENVARAGLEVHRPEARALRPHFRTRGAVASSARLDVMSTAPTASAEWLARRVSRTPALTRRYHGAVGPRAAGVYAVSHVERYLECPFKYFAAQVLRLEEERDGRVRADAAGAGPASARGLRSVLRGVAARGPPGVSTGNLDEALALFEEVAERQLLASAGRRTVRSSGPICSARRPPPGLAERAFAFEIEQGIGVVERLLEYRVRRRVRASRPGTEHRRVAVRGKADRIDVLADGTLARHGLQARTRAEACARPAAAGLRHLRAAGARADGAAIVAAGPCRLRRFQGEERVRRARRHVVAATRRCARAGSDSWTPSPASSAASSRPIPTSRCSAPAAAIPHVCRKDYVGDE